MECVHFLDGHAYASDGHILVKIPLDYIFIIDIYKEPGDQIDLLNGHCIDASLYKKICSYSEVWVQKNGDKTQLIVYFGDYPIRIDLKKAEDVRPPKFESVLKSNDPSEPIDFIGINHKWLSRLASAMGISDVMKISFTGKRTKAFVEPFCEFYGSTMRGIIMPSMVY